MLTVKKGQTPLKIWKVKHFYSQFVLTGTMCHLPARQEIMNLVAKKRGANSRVATLIQPSFQKKKGNEMSEW